MRYNKNKKHVSADGLPSFAPEINEAASPLRQLFDWVVQYWVSIGLYDFPTFYRTARKINRPSNMQPGKRVQQSSHACRFTGGGGVLQMERG